MVLGIRPNEWHPILVHFPIVLLLASFALDAYSRGRRKHLDRNLLLIVHGAGVVTGVLAIAAGFLALSTDVMTNPRAIPIAIWHERMAETTILWFGLLWLWRAWRYRLPASMPSRSWIVSMGAGVLGLCITGYLGGSLVYDYGVGVPPSVTAAGANNLGTHHGTTAQTTQTVSSATVKAGQRIYLATCTRCHGNLGQGGIATALGPGDVTLLGGLQQLAQFIQQAMPPGGPALSSATAASVAAYIQGTSTSSPRVAAASPPSTTPLSPGQRLFIQYCETCHGTNGVNELAVYKKGGLAGLASYIQRKMPQNQRGILTAQEAQALAKFISTIQPLPGQSGGN